MRRVLMTILTSSAACLAAAGISTSAQAVVVQIAGPGANGTFSGTECSGAGGFPNCYATQTGVQQGPTTDPLASPAIYKVNSDAPNEANAFFSTITGSEFAVNLASNVLSFTYTPGAGDPTIHYFAVKQADDYILFYDLAGITSGSVNLSTYFPNNPGYSHITWFDTAGVPTPTGAVPEPTTWAMILLGFGGMGMALRRRNAKNGQLLQIA